MNAAPSAADVARKFNLHRAGREWRGACPACGYGADAFVLTMKAGRTLGWCASCQDRNGIARLLAGGSPAPAAGPDANPDHEQQRQRTRERALRLWNGGEPAPGTIADTYLSARGLPGLAASPALRFRGDTPHPSGGRLPAMLARIDGPDGSMVALHRTFLTRDGRKASVEPVKASLGRMWGGAIRLHPLAAELAIGEGIESSASAGRLLGLPAWAAISAGNLGRGLVLPPEVRAVVIATDHDEPGERAAREAALRWQREGRKVRVARPNVAGQDFNDVIRARAGAVA